MSRPTIAEVYAYRAHVDQCMTELIENCKTEENGKSCDDVVLQGLHHEQHHQELLLMDIKHLYWSNPLRPIYNRKYLYSDPKDVLKMEWIRVSDFSLGSRLVTNGDYLEFMEAGGYREPAYWDAEGWARVQKENWSAPLYWEAEMMMTLGGMKKIAESEPVCHISFFEADAYARWTGASLPTESEWETAASLLPVQGSFLEDEIFHPRPASPARPVNPKAGLQIHQLYGDAWEWTKQRTLCGGSCVTGVGTVRGSGRNFYSPGDRRPFAGVRIKSEENQWS